MTRHASRLVTGTYPGEEITVTFTATMQRDWEGDGAVVNGLRPVETLDLGSIECARLEILGREIEYHTLPDEVQQLISSLSDEVEDWK